MNNIFIPKGKNIVTKYGCTCKNKYSLPNLKGKVFKNTCNMHNSDNPFCEVKGECGSHANYKKNYKPFWYDDCVIDNNNLDIYSDNYGKNFIKKNVKGFIIFCCIFLLFIPFILVKTQLQSYIPYYILVIPLIASSISFGMSRNYNGLVKNNIFQELYKSQSDLIITFCFTKILEFISLLSLLYIFITNIQDMDKILRISWLLFGLYYTLSFIIPEHIISTIQNKIFNHFIDSPKSSFVYKNIRLIITATGLFISFLVILFTKYALKIKFGKSFVDYIYYLLKKKYNIN